MVWSFMSVYSFPGVIVKWSALIPMHQLVGNGPAKFVDFRV